MPSAICMALRLDRSSRGANAKQQELARSVQAVAWKSRASGLGRRIKGW
jgi:hypothetical protein